MNRKISLLEVALAQPIFGREGYNRNFDRTLNVQSGAPVRLDHKLGDVTIRSQAGGTVVIHAEIRASASDQQQARDYANHIEILVDQGSGVAIRTRYPETPRSFLGMRNVSFSVHYEITVPESSPVSIRNAFGRVEATGLKAGTDITNSNGDVTFRDGRGTVRLQNSFARTEATNVQGDLTIETGNGAVVASDVAGRLAIRDRFANVTVARAPRGVTVINSNGAVELTDAG